MLQTIGTSTGLCDDRKGFDFTMSKKTLRELYHEQQNGIAVVSGQFDDAPEDIEEETDFTAIRTSPRRSLPGHSIEQNNARLINMHSGTRSNHHQQIRQFHGVGESITTSFTQAAGAPSSVLFDGSPRISKLGRSLRSAAVTYSMCYVPDAFARDRNAHRPTSSNGRENPFSTAETLLQVSKSNPRLMEETMSPSRKYASLSGTAQQNIAPSDTAARHGRQAQFSSLEQQCLPGQLTEPACHSDHESVCTSSRGYVSVPNENDVIFGRGKDANEYIGNKKFRSLVRKYGQAYFDSPRGDKKYVAHIIMRIIRHQTPPGTFLKRLPETSLWYQVESYVAMEKVTQALMRESRGMQEGKRPRFQRRIRSECPLSKSASSSTVQQVERSEETQPSPWDNDLAKFTR